MISCPSPAFLFNVAVTVAGISTSGPINDVFPTALQSLQLGRPVQRQFRLRQLYARQCHDKRRRVRCPRSCSGTGHMGIFHSWVRRDRLFSAKQSSSSDYLDLMNVRGDCKTSSQNSPGLSLTRYTRVQPGKVAKIQNSDSMWS